MRLIEFNNAYNAAKRRIRREGVAAVAPAEGTLRDLLPQLESDKDRRIATNLFLRLPRYAVPPGPPSDLMREAVAIERAAYETPGTAEERSAIMAEARRKIFEIAKRAPAGRSPSHPRPDPSPRTPRRQPPRSALATDNNHGGVMDGKFGLAEFNREYKLVRASLRSGDTSNSEAGQQQLRFLVPGLSTDHDRKVAEDLIADLPALLVDPPPRSPEMTEALHVLNTADLESGTVEQQLVAIDRTRKQIWAIADRAGGQDSANISGLTRMLERREDSLTEPWPWPEATADPT